MKKDSKLLASVKDLMSVAGLGAAIGALTCLGLSSTALSPLTIGGIIGSIFPGLFAAGCIAFLFFQFYCNVETEYNRRKDEHEDGYRNLAIRSSALTIASIGIGVGLAATITAIFPGAMLGMGPVALTGATIGAIAPIAGVLATAYIIEPIAEKVNEYIISPVIEKIKGCFSSKEQESLS
ncbi:MAG: hypothetical protein LBU02_03740 [Rickettsiales bacterium]|jgi:hypothetical protein|nr:hypothetical protein [Rickettsiales bacterium]